MQKPYGVLVVDDEEEIRIGISRKINWEALGFQLVGEAANGLEALELSEQMRPDVVLTDIKMPYMDGLELCRRLKQVLPAAKLVIFSGFDDFEYARQAIGIHVSEYILKPINAAELSDILTRLHTQLEHERLERQNEEALRRRYETSLPLLRELFYTSLLSGRIPQKEIRPRAEEYGISLPDGVWTVAAATLKSKAPGVTRDGLLLSAMDFLLERFSLENAAVRGFLYQDTVALLVSLDSREQLYPLLEEMERLCVLGDSLLGGKLRVGVGTLCHRPEEFSLSAEGAINALAYKALTGGRVIYIGDMEPESRQETSFLKVQQQIVSAVKLGTEEQVRQVVADVTEEIRRRRLSMYQCQIFFLETMISLIQVARTGGIELTTLLGPDFSGMALFQDFATLEDMSGWLTEKLLALRELLGRQRSDSAGKTMDRAMAYIDEHFQESDLNVETLSVYLHLSPTYFSTLFKKETGLSFINYVTKVRMERAAQLLRDTDDKTYLIADQTGYADANYFSYVFKKYYGMTPSKFRTAQRG